MTHFRGTWSRIAAEAYAVGGDYWVTDTRGTMTCECIEKIPASEGRVRITFACPRSPDADAGFVLQYVAPPPTELSDDADRLLKFFTNHKG